jgi:hypothetical protein
VSKGQDDQMQGKRLAPIGIGTKKTHLHPVEFRIVVGLRKASEHEVVRVLEERAPAKAGWSEHGRVQGRGRLVRVRMGVRGLLLLMVLRWRRRGRRRKILAGLVDDAQLYDGRRVDWSTIGCGDYSERPQRMALHMQKRKRKPKKN